MDKQTVIKSLLWSGAAAAGTYAGYAALTYARLGRPPAGRAPASRLDALMSDFDVRDAHQRHIEAPAQVSYRWATNISLYDSPLARAIFGLRTLISRVRGELGEPAPPRPLLEEAHSFGWRTLEHEPGRYIALGAVTQPWRASVEFTGLSREAFEAFDEPGHAKIVWSIEALPTGANSTRLRAETRVATTDPASREKFRRYWSLVSPGVVLIRTEMLRLAKKSAERAHLETPSGPARQPRSGLARSLNT